MNQPIFHKIKVNKRSQEIRKELSHTSFSNSNIINSIIRRKINPQNTIKTLNSEISQKIKDNIANDIFNNNGNTLNSLLLKSNHNGGIIEENSLQKSKKMKTIEAYRHHHHYISRQIKNVDYDFNGGTNIEENIGNSYMKKSNTNKNTIECHKKMDSNNSDLSNKYQSPNIQKNNGKNGKGTEKKIDEVIINYLKDKNYEKMECKTDLNKNTKNLSYINKYQDKIKKNKTDKIEGKKVYKRKTIRNYETNNNSNYSINIYNSQDNDKNKIYSESKSKGKDKYFLLLNNYRKRVIKQFMFYFKPYYYSFIRKHFHIFILKIKNMSKDINIPNTSSPKKFMKKIKNSENDSNIQNKKNNENGKIIKDLKLVQLNYSNYNYTNVSNQDTDNSNNYVLSYNTRKNQSDKEFSNPKKKLNFLLNNNNINFGIEEQSGHEELYRNNFELEKKYTQILQRKKRKKLFMKDYGYLNSSAQVKSNNKTLEASSSHNKAININNSFDNQKSKNNNFPHKKESLDTYKKSNEEYLKGSIIVEKKKTYVKIKTIPKKQKERDKKIKENTIKNKINNKLNISETIKAESINRPKKTYLKNTLIKVHKNKNKTLIISKKEKIDNINKYRYNRNFISKTIKNIFTKDKKINIHINYVFFIPPINNEKYFDLFKKNNSLEIHQNFSFTYIGNQRNKNLIYSKIKLAAIKEEEERSKCSMSMTQHNAKTFEEYNSIINYMANKINNYLYRKIKKNFLRKLKLLNFLICSKIVIKRHIFNDFNQLNISGNDDDEKDENEVLSQPRKTSDANGIFLVDDKIIMNMNNMNNENFENEN
jgi:hypothetical protein